MAGEPLVIVRFDGPTHPLAPVMARPHARDGGAVDAAMAAADGMTIPRDVVDGRRPGAKMD